MKAMYLGRNLCSVIVQIEYMFIFGSYDVKVYQQLLYAAFNGSIKQLSTCTMTHCIVAPKKLQMTFYPHFVEVKVLEVLMCFCFYCHIYTLEHAQSVWFNFP